MERCESCGKPARTINGLCKDCYFDREPPVEDEGMGTCPGCGAPTDRDWLWHHGLCRSCLREERTAAGTSEPVACPYCGNTFIIHDEYGYNCPDSGLVIGCGLRWYKSPIYRANGILGEFDHDSLYRLFHTFAPFGALVHDVDKGIMFPGYESSPAEWRILFYRCNTCGYAVRVENVWEEEERWEEGHMRSPQDGFAPYVPSPDATVADW